MLFHVYFHFGSSYIMLQLLLSYVFASKGSSSTQPPKEAAKDAHPKEAPSKSSGSSSKGPDKKFEFSFNLAKYVHCASVFEDSLIFNSH